MSQSIKSDHISESTIARIAGNILSGVMDDSDLHRAAKHGADENTVRGAVTLARAIASEVQRTRGET